MTPEEQARESIDGMLSAAGWLIQDRADANIDAGRGVAIREFALGRGFGEADYLLFADGQAVGGVEAKKEGTALIGVELQTQKYSEGNRVERPQAGTVSIPHKPDAREGCGAVVGGPASLRRGGWVSGGR